MKQQNSNTRYLRAYYNGEKVTNDSSTSHPFEFIDLQSAQPPIIKIK